MVTPVNSGKTFNVVYTSLIIFIFILLAVSCFFNLGRPGYNQNALLVYGYGATAGIAIALIFGGYGVFNWIKAKATGTEIPFQSGHVSETSKYLLLSRPLWLRFVVHAIWVGVIIFASLSGFQIWPEPDLYSETTEFAVTENAMAVEQFGMARSIWDVGVLPSFTEDMASMALSAVFVAIILGLVLVMRFTTKSNLFRFNAIWMIVAILIACPLAALGLGFIPGFAQAHTIVAGEDVAFLFAAFVFQTFNLYIFWATGWFFPLAHLVHNSIFILSFNLAFSIALFATVPIIGRKLYLKRPKNNFGLQ